MTSNRIALLASLCLVLATTAAYAGRSRGMQNLDTDTLLLPYIEQENVYKLTYARSATGQALLVDQSLATAVRVTPLGFTPPLGANVGNYVATPDGSVWAAFASAHGVRVYDLGDLERPGALAPALLQREQMGGDFEPESVQMGIIAVLIGLLAEPTPSISFQITDVTDGTSNTLTFAWDGDSFDSVAEVGDGTWTWSHPQ